MTTVNEWIVFIHVLAAFAFVLGHGVSMVVLFRIRGETDATRIAAQLDVSLASMWVAFSALLVLLVSGIAAGFTTDAWGNAWIWVSLGLLVLVAVYMGWRATVYLDAVRHAIGTKGMHDKKDAEVPTPSSPEDLAALLHSGRPTEIALVGGIGLVVIVYLMYFKPF